MNARFSLAGWPRRRLLLVVACSLIVLASGVYLLWEKEGDRNPILVAIALPLSGPQSQQGKNALRGVEMYFKEVNQQGGIHGRKIKVVPYDDESNPEVARKKAEEIVASRSVAVLGHLLSNTSEAAGPIYKGKVPAVTGTAKADTITQDNEWYFRTIFDASAEGRNLAMYVRKILDRRVVGVIASPDSYGNAITAAFTETFLKKDDTEPPPPLPTLPPVAAASAVAQAGGLPGLWQPGWLAEALASIPPPAPMPMPTVKSWIYDPSPEKQKQSLDEIAAGMQTDPPVELVLLVVNPNTAGRDVVVGLRERMLKPGFLCGTSLGAGAFGELFDEIEKKLEKEPGYFTEGVLVVSPLLYDSANARAQEFLNDYKDAYNSEPDAYAGKYYDAAQVLVAALKNARVHNSRASRDEDRQKLQKSLSEDFNDVAKAVQGISGPIYFDKTRSQPQTARIGKFFKKQLISSEYQLALLTSPALLDLDRAYEKKNVVMVGGQLTLKQRVVYTGIDFNQVIQINQTKGTFIADFYVWFRYPGEDDVLEVEFPSAVERRFDPKAPVEKKELEDKTNYRLYRVRDEFRNNFNFSDYPFDRQNLTLRLQNTRLPREEVVYAIDTFGLRLPRPKGAGAEAFEPLSQWSFRDMRYFQETQGTQSTRGNPAAFFAGGETQFSGFNAVAVIQRRTTVFLIKMMLPLVLLVLVVYVTLHFPETMISERLGIAVSALLASAVVLTGINSQLTEANYTTAIEYGFYVFFGLCLFCIIVGLGMARMRNANMPVGSHWLNLASRVVYMAVVFGTVAVYAFLYGGRG